MTTKEWREANPESHRASSQKWRENNRDQHRAYSNAWYAENRDLVAAQREATYRRRKAILDRFKTFKGCLICGYRAHPAALHFHHVYPEQKSGQVGKYIRSSMAAVRREIAKCVVLCSNCHAVVHSFGFRGEQFEAINRAMDALMELQS